MRKLLAVLLSFCVLLPAAACAGSLATPTDLCEHVWVQRDGKSVCSVCGAVNPCTVNHKENYEVTPFFYEDSEVICEENPADDCFHLEIGLGYIIRTCYACGAYLGREDGLEVSLPDFHEYEEGVCTVCGHACRHSRFEDGRCIFCGCECAHPSTVRRYAFRSGGGYETVYVPENVRYHTASGAGKVWDECIVCGKRFNEEEIAELTVQERHTYKNGECVFCHLRRVISPKDSGAASEEETAEAVKGMLDCEAEAEVITDGETGGRTVVLTPGPEEGKDAVTLTADAETLEKAAAAGVREIVLRNGRGEAVLDVAVLQRRLAENEGAKLVIVLEREPGQLAAGPETEYGTVGGARLCIRRIVRISADGTETGWTEGVALRLETEYARGMQILYAGAEGAAAVVPAEYTEATEDTPGRWEFSCMGSGVYLLVIPETAR